MGGIYMKLGTKILLIAIFPLVIMGAVIYFLGSGMITNTMQDEIKSELQAICISIKGADELSSAGDYELLNGQLWKGDRNVSESYEIADRITKDTGIAVTVFWGDTRYMTSVMNGNGERILGTKASDRVIENVLNQRKEYFSTNVDVMGENYYGYYQPIFNEGNDTPVGMIFAGKSQEEAEAEINGILFRLLAIIIVVFIIASILIVFVCMGIEKGIQHVIDITKKVAEGDLSISKAENSTKLMNQKNEMGNLVNQVMGLRLTIKEMIMYVVDNAKLIHDSAETLGHDSQDTLTTIEQVENAVMEIAKGATSQAGETQRATENVISIGSMIEETNDEVEILHKNSYTIKESGDRAATKLEELSKINTETQNAIEEIYQQTNTTNESAEKIIRAVEAITAIAKQTNLLSLNASIEAARAGEHGKGFAVVASQIQLLAEQSNNSANEVNEIVKRLIEDSSKAVGTMDDVRVIMKKQSEAVEVTGQMVSDVIKGVDASVDSITAIASKTEQMDQARKQVIDIVQGLTAIAQENAASTEETSASVSQVSEIISEVSENAKKLQEISEQLSQKTSKYKF